MTPPVSETGTEHQQSTEEHRIAGGNEATATRSGSDPGQHLGQRGDHDGHPEHVDELDEAQHEYGATDAGHRGGGHGLRIPRCGVLTHPCVRPDLPFVGTYGTVDEWSVLVDPTRRAIVERLADRPLAVGELANELPVSRPAVSQHLKVLKDAGLVTEQADGTRRIYRLDPIAVGALRDQLDTFWRSRARRLPGRSATANAGGIMTETAAQVVRRQVVVDAPIEQAFATFTDRFGDFKPPEHNLLSAPLAETVFEPRSAATSMTAARMGPSATGHGCSPTSPRTGWCSAGTSARSGPSRLTRRTRVRSRSGSSRRPPNAPGSSWSIATSTGTALAGRPFRDGVDDEQGWPLYLARYADLLAGHPA